MRRAIWFVGLLPVCFFGACGLAENGLLEGDASISNKDVDVPETCKTLDAACVGALPQGFQPVAIGNGSCGGDWSGITMFTNPQVVAGGCACGACAPTNAYACDAGVPISGGNNCGDDPFATATPGACTNVNATQHLKAHAVQATGSVACSAPNDAGAGATSDSILVCVPGCTADFCGGSSQCAMAEGDVACPSGFSLFAHAGTGVDPGCAPCTCEAGAPGTCSGNVTAYFNDGCDAGDDAGVYAIESCNVINNQYQSVFVALTPPDASCTLTSSTITGDASLIGTMTICCK